MAEYDVRDGGVFSRQVPHPGRSIRQMDSMSRSTDGFSSRGDGFLLLHLLEGLQRIILTEELREKWDL